MTFLVEIITNHRSHFFLSALTVKFFLLNYFSHEPRLETIVEYDS